MKKTITTLILTVLPGFAFADLADFGTTTRAHKSDAFLVTGVFANTPASELGLKKGDIVTEINGGKVHATTSLARLVAGFCEPDSTISVAWKRDGNKMGGETTLSGSLTAEAFEERYPKGRISRARKGKNSKVSGRSGNAPGVTGSGDDIEKTIREALKGRGLVLDGLLAGGGKASVQVTQIMKSYDGSSIRISAADNGASKVSITTPDGEKAFEGTITKDELEKVPEKYRENVKTLISGGIGILGGRAIDKGAAPEKDASQLLKEIEEEDEKE